MYDGCGCALGAKGGSCSLQFLETDVLFNLIVWNFQMMNWTFTHRKSSGTKRSKNPRCSFYYQSIPICKEMFLHFYGLSDS